MNLTGTSDRLAAELAGRLGELTQALRREVQVGQVSPTLSAVLSTLERDGAKRVSELADIAQVSQPTMTTLLRRLGADGAVSRGTDPHDQRAVVIELTDAGRALLARVRAARESALADRLAGLEPADRDALAAAIPAIDRLLEHWRKVDPS